MHTARVNLAAFAVLAAVWAGLPLATPEPAIRPVVPLTVVEAPAIAWTDTALTLTVEGSSPTIPEPAPHISGSDSTTDVANQEMPQVTGSARDRALGELARLGAPAWVIGGFDCIGWYESKWNTYAVSPTDDHGVFQINRRYHAWRWAGRDIYDVIVNTGIAWNIYRESGFRAWTTAKFCGV